MTLLRPWSVGCNPMSITSQGWHLSRFQLDVIARSYIITALEESIQAVNTAINHLVLERTSILELFFLDLFQNAGTEKFL